MGPYFYFLKIPKLPFFYLKLLPFSSSSSSVQTVISSSCSVPRKSILQLVDNTSFSSSSLVLLVLPPPPIFLLPLPLPFPLLLLWSVFFLFFFSRSEFNCFSLNSNDWNSTLSLTDFWLIGIQIGQIFIEFYHNLSLIDSDRTLSLSISIIRNSDRVLSLPITNRQRQSFITVYCCAI